MAASSRGGRVGSAEKALTGSGDRLQTLSSLFHYLEPLAPWLTAVGVLMAVLSMTAIPWLVVRMPADYFVTDDKPALREGAVAWLVWALRNLLGLILVLAGILMLILPGQGILTILLGIACSTFPGKYRLERRLVSQPKVLATLNWIRRKYRRPPLLSPND